MNCDLVARPYRTLEHLAFRTTLERQRFAFLEQAADVRRALILGEGDGRFVCELAKRNPEVTIDCIEASAEMIRVAQHRLRSANVNCPQRVCFLQRDAMAGFGGGDRYDLIVTHFFLDCFSQAEVEVLVDAVRAVCTPAAKWLIAEFQQPDAGWRKWHARLWIDTMYLLFRIATGLKTRKLPSYRALLRGAGFTLQDRKFAYAELISSEIWQGGGHFPGLPV